MTGDLTLVDSLLYENGAIRRHCREIGKLLAEQETIVIQRKSDLISVLAEELARQKLNLEQATMTLEDALLRHKELHAELPSPLFGTLLAEALEMEHSVMLEAIAKARLEIPTDLKELTRAELLAKSLQIKSAHESACVLVEAHLSKENAILELVKRALRAKQ